MDNVSENNCQKLIEENKFQASASGQKKSTKYLGIIIRYFHHSDVVLGFFVVNSEQFFCITQKLV